MTKLNIERLDAAYQLGFIGRKLKYSEKLCLHPSILTCNKIIEVVNKSGHNGLDIEQLSARLELNSNTVKTYCRWIREKQLINYEIAGSGGKVTYYPVE